MAVVGDRSDRFVSIPFVLRPPGMAAMLAMQGAIASRPVEAFFMLYLSKMSIGI